MTTRGARIQSFDRANRLMGVSGIATYEYDGYGRRTATRRSVGTGKMDIYTQDGVLRYTSDNARSGATVYVHLGDQLVAERFANWDGTNAAVEYVHGDLIGSAVARTTSTGVITERERSLSYGQAIDGAKREAPGFTGHMEDPGVGLVYMQQRYYDPAIGRFLSVDPVGPLDNPINHFGRYHYANNNPYKYTDPDGNASVNVFRPEEKGGLFFNAGESFNIPGVFTIAGHGGAGFIQDQTMVIDGKYDSIRAFDLKSVLSSDFGLEAGQTVMSTSCHFGATNANGVNAAQQLARDNRSTVYGADGYVNFRADGDKIHLEVFSGTNRTGTRGYFVGFDSKGSRVIGSAIESITINTKTGSANARYGSTTGSRVGRGERVPGKKP